MTSAITSLPPGFKALRQVASEHHQFVPLQVLHERIGDDEIEASRRQPRDLLGPDDADLRLLREAGGDAGAHGRRRLAQEQAAAFCRHEIGMQRLAAAVVEHARLRRGQQPDDVGGDGAVMHVEMARIGVDRMIAVPEADPVLHGVSEFNIPQGEGGGEWSEPPGGS